MLDGTNMTTYLILFTKDFINTGSMVKAYFQFSRPMNLPAPSKPVSVNTSTKEEITGYTVKTRNPASQGAVYR
jgi:hypothetical protein